MTGKAVELVAIEMKPYLHDRRSFLAAGVGITAGLVLKPSFGGTQDLTSLTLKQASELLKSRAASPVDLTQACLKRIGSDNSALNAFVTVTGEQALAAARAMEAEQLRGIWRGPLHGILFRGRWITSVRCAGP